MKKAYFFDMDGTLYAHKLHAVPRSALNALQLLKEQGHMVCLATSRTLEELAHLEKEVRTFPFDYRIVDGGALILDKEGRIVYEKTIDPAACGRIAAFCRQTGTPWRYADKNGTWWDIEGSQKEHDQLFSLYLRAPAIRPFDGGPVLNAIVFTKEREKIGPLIADCGVVWYGSCVEIRAQHVDKAEAVRRICAKEKIGWTCCFGDGSNDIDMLMQADRGIAMGNASEKLKEAADLVIGRVDEDGVWNYVKESMEGETCTH